jgi:hypothetical protein
MHSFHHSRSRILFEVFCALAISASCVGAWMQSGAWALLPAAAVAALYGIVHSFDLRRRNSINLVEPQEIELAPDRQGDFLARLETSEQAVANNELEVVQPAQEAERVEPAAPRERQGSTAKARRKGPSRRASAPEKAKVIELAPSEDADIAIVTPPEDAARPHIEPLFEPETFVRMPRQAFGRKAG